MKFVAFIVGMAGGYAVAHAAGLGAGGAAAIGWAVALAAVFLAAKLRSRYSSAWVIEQYRPRAEALSVNDPDLYNKILAQSGDSTSGATPAVANRDPNAYVACWMAAAEGRLT